MDNACESIRELMSQLLDGVSDTDRKARVQEHAAQCPACAEYLRGLETDHRNLIELVDGMRENVSNIQTRVIEAMGSEPLPFGFGIGRVFARWYGLVACAAVVLIGISLAIYQAKRPAADTLDPSSEVVAIEVDPENGVPENTVSENVVEEDAVKAVAMSSPRLGEPPSDHVGYLEGGMKFNRSTDEIRLFEMSVHGAVAYNTAVESDSQVDSTKQPKEGILRIVKAKIGDKAPDFEGVAFDGSRIALSAYRGKVVLLEFWTSWCGPCKAHLKDVAGLYATYHPYGLEVIGISLESDAGAWRRFLAGHSEITWPQIWDPDDRPAYTISDRYYGATKGKVIPKSVLVDVAGRIRASTIIHEGSTIDEDFIAGALAERIRLEYRKAHPKRPLNQPVKAPLPKVVADRTISFPENGSLGQLYVRKWGWPSLNDPDRLRDRGWRKLAEARGSVSVGENKEVLLVLRKDLDADLWALSGLKAYDLQGLTFQAGGSSGVQLGHVAGLAGLKELDLRGTSVTDDELKHLRRLPSLRKLLLSDTRVGDRGMEHVKHLRGLEKLNLYGTRVSDEGIGYLCGLDRLEWLNIYRTRVSDAGLLLLSKLPALKQLQLSGRISDAGVARLSKVRKLSVLDITSKAVTDEGLKHISGFSRLRRVNLWNTQITDAGLKYLRGMESLEYLGISKSRVTPLGLLKLQQSLPQCEVNIP